jgi:hypothetical protein
MSDNPNEARDNLIIEWRAKAAEFKAIQEEERQLRAKVVATMFPNPTKGTNRFQLGGGYALKLANTFKAELGNKDLLDPDTNEKIPINKQVEWVEDQIAELGDDAMSIASSIIKWKPECSLSEFEKLDATEMQLKIKALIEPIMTIKQNSPQLELEVPK